MGFRGSRSDKRKSLKKVAKIPTHARSSRKFGCGGINSTLFEVTSCVLVDNNGDH
jgi:hypothetical protein